MYDRTALILITALTILLASPCPGLAATDQQQARQLLNALGCKSCHRLEGQGGSLAPELDQIGTRLTAKQIQQLLAEHGQGQAEHNMPSYDTTSAAELELIANYLYNLNPD